MFPVEIISLRAHENGLRFLVIGGHAVNAYSEPRATLDVDILVCRDDRAAWSRILQGGGFTLFRDAGPFLQFSPPYGIEWRLDLMLVNADTFEKLVSMAHKVRMLGIEAMIPSPEHFIALKLHALKHGPEDQFEKDFGDVVGVTRNTGLDPRAPSYRQLFDQFGTPELYEKILKRIG